MLYSVFFIYMLHLFSRSMYVHPIRRTQRYYCTQDAVINSQIRFLFSENVLIHKGSLHWDVTVQQGMPALDPPCLLRVP